ncbi:helix-turn-helix transcriptional regulator [Oceanicella sp. SM1341]|uniref:helix-turn-helix domain-containing protein n=1 Tax=Oceanicella sp. SM1341 TaxID=1548889 RepID=UPI000E48CB28
MDDTDMKIAGYGRITKEHIGRRLAAARIALGKTQEEMSEAAGLDVGVYGHRERGRTSLSPAEAWSLFESLGVSPTFLLFGDPTALGMMWPRIRAALSVLPSPESEARPRRGRPPKKLSRA